MGLIKECFGRKFSNIQNFETYERKPGRPSGVYLNTIEKGCSISPRNGRKSDIKFRIQKWRKINDKNDKNIKYWDIRPSTCRHYYINSFEQLEDISNILNDFVGSHDTVSLSTEAYERFQLESRKQKVKIKNLIEKIHSLKSINSTINAERQTFKHRISLMRTNIKDLKSILNDYQKLISMNNTNETDVKDFLENNHAYWMFGLEYLDIKREVGVPFGHGKKDFFLDFMLQRHDDYLDLVECKGPNENLFDRRTKKRTKPNEKLSEAIGQVFKYLYAIDKLGDERVIKPKAYIVIGNQDTDISSERRIFSSYLSNTEIITYFELYKRGQQLLKHIKKIKN